MCEKIGSVAEWSVEKKCIADCRGVCIEKDPPIFLGLETTTTPAASEFESAEKIEAWYQSEAYQALISTREEGAEMTISILEGF